MSELTGLGEDRLLDEEVNRANDKPPILSSTFPLLYYAAGCVTLLQGSILHSHRFSYNRLPLHCRWWHYCLPIIDVLTGLLDVGQHFRGDEIVSQNHRDADGGRAMGRSGYFGHRLSVSQATGEDGSKIVPQGAITERTCEGRVSVVSCFQSEDRTGVRVI
jgi:hypothetical protein